MDSSKEEDEEIVYPVSPTGQYFNSTVFCAYVLCVLESQIPIDDSPTMSLLKDVFLPINSRFSSIMVDRNGKKTWKKVTVKLEEHIKVPVFPPLMSLQSYDKYFDDYLCRIATERSAEDQKKPLWDIHIIKYPKSNGAAGSLIFRLHHALGDGYSLMGALFSCLQRADNPTLPLTFPMNRRLSDKKRENESMFEKMNSFFSSAINTTLDFGESLLKSTVVQDHKTPIRSGDEGIKFRPISITNITFPLDYIKEIRSKLGVTVNDVITGIIFFGIRLYMQEKNYESRKANSTALVMLNTRNIAGYQSVKEMIKIDAKAPWGNRISFLHVSIPKLSSATFANPLQFVFKAHQIIKMKRYSLGVLLTGSLLDMMKKFKGPEAVARHIYRTMGNTSLSVSNLVGPVEQMALANHPAKDIYFTMTGDPQSLTITIMSYMENLNVTLKAEKGFIDEQKFKSCMENAYEMILKAAWDIPSKKKI
ncbi:O-acyltransferase WSD1 [Quillaja saponaria]|uniref:O-acyltransferase WSD1 n=1 Tax=Quillaja saponaria TaxID=32244 RepID=A0AAD7PXT6_QUISA|nr:O-acyltransferase WSD1 [Quillaja saponaria]